MYCAWRIPAHLRCTQCSILLHLMDICFLTCICLWQISQIQTFLFKVVGPGLVSTSPAFVSSSASHPAGPHGRHAQKTVNRAPKKMYRHMFAISTHTTSSHYGSTWDLLRIYLGFTLDPLVNYLGSALVMTSRSRYIFIIAYSDSYARPGWSLILWL